jgi:HlyD family secretion protein
MKRWTRRSLAAGGVAIAALAGWRLLQPPRVQVAAAARGDILDTVYASGTVEPDPRIEIDAQVRGTLIDPLEEGARVARGQLLARIDNPSLGFERDRTARTLAGARARTGPELRARTAELAAARAAEADARTRLGRARNLNRSGAVTRAELDAAIAAHDRTLAEVAAAESRRAAASESLEEARGTARAQYGAAASRASEAEVRSPIDGAIVGRRAEPGEYVSEGQLLFVVGDVDRLVLELVADEADVGALRVGQRATATLDAFPDRTFAGEVAEIAADADRASRTYQVEVRLHRPPDGLRPGMSAEATIEVGRADGVVLVPAAALAGDRVWVVEGGRASRRRVVVGIRELTWVEVRDGLAAGEEVIVGGRAPEGDGARVAPERVDLALPVGPARAAPLSRGD